MQQNLTFYNRLESNTLSFRGWLWIIIKINNREEKNMAENKYKGTQTEDNLKAALNELLVEFVKPE